MRFPWLILAFGLVACESDTTATTTRPPDAGHPAAEAGDAGADADEGPIPPAPTEPGCAMTVDGEPLRSSGSGGAELGSYNGQPNLRLLCAGVRIDIARPRGPGEYEAVANYGQPDDPEYQGPCTTRLDRAAFKERGGLAARVRCDVPLMRALRGGTPKPRIRLSGYVVLPPAGPLPAPEANAGPGPDRCTFSVTGEYTREGGGEATRSTCGDDVFAVLTEIPVAFIRPSFCPTCRTAYSGKCTRTNIVQREKSEESDVECELRHELSGELRVKAHLDGARILVP